MRPIIITLLVMLSVVPSFAEGTDLDRLKEGDIIFVFSKSLIVIAHYISLAGPYHYVELLTIY